jgi:hypothetical protein
MNFRSDNEAGAHPLIIEALGRAFTSGSASIPVEAGTPRAKSCDLRKFIENGIKGASEVKD